jgi:hypothetical protein
MADIPSFLLHIGEKNTSPPRGKKYEEKKRKEAKYLREELRQKRRNR